MVRHFPITPWSLLTRVRYAGKPHFWSELILDHLYFITLADNLHRFPIVPTLARILFPSTMVVKNKNSQYSRDLVARLVKSIS